MDQPAPDSVHVAVDALAYGERPGGVGRYIENLIRGFAQLPSGPRLTVIGRAAARAQLAPLGAAGTEFAGPGLLGSSGPARILWEQCCLERVARRHGCDLVHGLMGVVPLGARLPSVVTIHDVTFLTHPWFHTRAKVAYFSRILPLAAHAARLVITDSAASRDAIVTTLGVAPDRVRVVHLSLDPAFRPPTEAEVTAALSRYQLRPPFALYAGVIEPRKNLPRLLAAAVPLVKSGELSTIALAGKTGWRAEPTLAAIHGAGVAVTRLGYVPDADLRALIGGCAVFAYVPEVEGFGLPVGEALACGAPVVTSATSSLPEVAGGAAELVDPMDPAAITAGLRRVLGDPQLRAERRQLGLARASELSEVALAAATAAVYTEALNQPREVARSQPGTLR